MLKKRALRKIFITTLTAFILLVVYLIPGMERTYKTNLEVSDITGLNPSTIYLLDKNNNRLVKSKIFLSAIKVNDKIKELISNLTITASNNLPDGLSPVIPNGTKILDFFYDEEYLSINFSKEFKNTDNIEQVIEALTYSLIDLGKIKNIIIEVDGECIDNYCLPLDKSIGINKKVEISKRNNIEKVTIYYLEDINKTKYYVPVTKYLNSEKSKIEVIIDELSSSYIYENNLMSFLNSNTKLIDYDEENNIMFLNFNNSIFDKNNKLLEEVVYSIAYSVFDNYDVSSVFFKVDNKIIKEVGLTN